MINEEKWLRSLAIVKPDLKEAGSGELYSDTIEAIPKKNTYSSIKKYSLVAILFVGGLLFVSAIKNETRSLQREINILHASISEIKFNLNQALLDNEVMTSPENVSRLAKEYLEDDLVFYERSQIRRKGENNQLLTKSILKKENSKINKLGEKTKKGIAKKIKTKKEELKKLQEIYSNPSEIPKEAKVTFQKKIKTIKEELVLLKESPKDALISEKITKWGGIQLVKAFLGIPVIPGK